jgi:hypothetical protein
LTNKRPIPIIPTKTTTKRSAMEHKPNTKGKISTAIVIIMGIIAAIYIIANITKTDDEKEISLQDYQDISQKIYIFHCFNAADIATQEIKTKNKITTKGSRKIIDAIETCRITTEKNSILDFPVVYREWDKRTKIDPKLPS